MVPVPKSERILRRPRKGGKPYLAYTGAERLQARAAMLVFVRNRNIALHPTAQKVRGRLIAESSSDGVGWNGHERQKSLEVS